MLLAAYLIGIPVCFFLEARSSTWSEYDPRDTAITAMASLWLALVWPITLIIYLTIRLFKSIATKRRIHD